MRELLARRPNDGGRYVVEGEIARGGMRAILRAVDGDIRREVAVKYLLDQTDPAKKLPFVEEAQITGQLEHPNIVPIHELGIDGQDRLYFSMKMVKGRSLAQVFDELRQHPKTAEKEWPLSRLLTLFVSVCHALAYAHARNVIHLVSCPRVQDLRPLENLKLEEVFFTPRAFRKEALESLRRMTGLKVIGISQAAKDRLPPAEFWKKYEAGEFAK